MLHSAPHLTWAGLLWVSITGELSFQRHIGSKEVESSNMDVSFGFS